MGRLKEIVFDCAHAAQLARFWAALIDGYAVRAYDDAEIARLAALGFTPDTDPTVMVDGPGPSLCFQQMPARHHVFLFSGAPPSAALPLHHNIPPPLHVDRE